MSSFLSANLCNTQNKLIDEWLLKICTECFSCISRLIANKTINFPSSLRARSHIFSNNFIISKQPILYYNNFVHSMVLLNLVKRRLIICNLSQYNSNIQILTNFSTQQHLFMSLFQTSGMGDTMSQLLNIRVTSF